MLSYTLSRSIDDNCGIGRQLQRDRTFTTARRMWQISDTNQTNNFTAAFTVQSPFGKPGAGGNQVFKALAGGWTLNGIVQTAFGLRRTR